MRSMQDMARRIAQNYRDAKIEIEVEDYVAKFKPFMMDVVFEWCKGASFSEVCKMTDLFEGKYSGDLNTRHSNNGIFRKLNILMSIDGALT